MITLQTNLGDITIELDTERTPKTAANFLNHAQNGHYDNTIFHRVIDGFMVQGGGMDATMQEKPDQPCIENEADLGGPNERGSVAMARTSDPHSASTQFFINVADNAFLNFKDKSVNGWGYCVFGKVTKGMEVVDKIKKVATSTRNGHQNVPAENVLVKKVILAAT